MRNISDHTFLEVAIFLNYFFKEKYIEPFTIAASE